MNIEEFDKEFKRKIIAQGGNWKTAKTYANHLCLLMSYYENKYKSPLHISFRDLEDYIIVLCDKKYSASYINSFIASVKRFYDINGQPEKCKKLVYQDNPIKTPNILTYNECKLMCDANIYLKHQLVVNLLYYGALRRGELLRLKLTDFSENRTVTIIASKFGKSRVITIPQHTYDLVNKYINEFKPNEYLLNSDKGTGQYSEKSVENIIKNVAKVVGIDKRTYPHIMRSSRATHLLDSGASDTYVSQFLGHSKLQVTKDFYLALTKKGMQNNFDKADEISEKEYKQTRNQKNETKVNFNYNYECSHNYVYSYSRK